LDDWKLLSVKLTINDGIKGKVLENASNRHLKSIGVHPFARTEKQAIRGEDVYMINVNTLNDNLIDLSNVFQLRDIETKYMIRLKEGTVDDEFIAYVNEQTPFH
jgi:hypothetical protein